MNVIIEVILELSTYVVVLNKDGARSTLFATKSIRRAEQFARDAQTTLKSFNGACGCSITCSRVSK
jgi:hypothetical protein